jgi:spermidine/putrescine transport system permease protein
VTVADLPALNAALNATSALLLVISTLYTSIGLGFKAMVLGHVTFSISFILVIVRARLVSIGSEFETAGQDLGATRMQAIRTILLPMLPRQATTSSSCPGGRTPPGSSWSTSPIPPRA